MLMTVTGMLLTMFTYFVVSCLKTTGTYVRTYVHPTLLGAESWLEAVSRVLAGSLSCCSVAVFILGWANLNHVRTYVRTTLGWKPGPTFWNLNLNHVRTYFTWLEAWTYVRTYVLESQSELVALTPILYVTVRKVAFLISCEAAEPRKHCRMRRWLSLIHI